MCAAGVKGNATKVTAKMIGTSYQTELEKNPKDGLYYGVLWDKAMVEAWGKNEPVEKTVRFTATFENGEVLTYDVVIIFDDSETFWNLHRGN